ncbi:MAG: hypothetical protein ACREMO_10095 [Gemmatimonadales bacterium]
MHWGSRLAWISGIAGAALLGADSIPRAQSDPHWITATGVEWQQMSPEARRAYAAGFLTGGALAQALGPEPADSAAVARTLDSLRHEGFRFPFAASVYSTRINDYYWWENHRPQPLWRAFWEVNNDLKRLTRHE